MPTIPFSRACGKGSQSSQITHALKLTYDANLMIEGGFIFGDINESKETVANTLSFWRQHNDMHYLNLAMISVFPGSFLYKHACNAGIIKDQEQFLRDGCPLVNVSKLTGAEYQDLDIPDHRTAVAPSCAGRIVPDRVQSGRTANAISNSPAASAELRAKSEVPFWFGMEMQCPSCGLMNFIDPFQNALHRHDAFSALPAE